MRKLSMRAALMLGLVSAGATAVLEFKTYKLGAEVIDDTFYET